MKQMKIPIQFPESGVSERRFPSTFLVGLLSASLLVLAAVAGHASSATWNLSPSNGIWYSASNWTPATVPNTISDTATFGVSNITTLSYAPGGLLSDLGTFAFTSDASPYTINFANNLYPAMIGVGVMNDSGILQAFSIPPSGEFRDVNETNNMVSFINSATTGILTQWTVKGSATGAYRPGELFFNDTATAASATIIVNPGGSDIGGEDGDGFGGILDFRDSSTADHATITVTGGAAGADYGSPPDAYFTDTATAANATITMTGGTISLGNGGILEFYSNSTAASATITNQAGAVEGGRPGKTFFWDTATAGNATIIANAGTDGTSGGLVSFYGNATGGTARFELFGNGTLDISFSLAPGVTVGSVEGDGLVVLAGHALTVGSNNLSSTFSGVIQDSEFESGGALAKVGSGTLTLSGANTYTGGTTVNAGVLLAVNGSGSATGTGVVSVNTGTLGGSGIIAGAVIIGGGAGAILAPGIGNPTQVTLTLRRRLTLQAGAKYIYGFKAKTNQSRADLVIAKGVTINGATIALRGRTQGTLTPGMILTVISNTSANPISGTFSNLADGAIVTVNGNNLQASYTGGDGNDLTLTVVP